MACNSSASSNSPLHSSGEFRSSAGSSECSSSLKEFRCDCGKNYRHQESLAAHWKFGGCRKSEQYACPHCPFTSNKLVRMKSHMYYSHGSEPMTF